MQVQAVMHLNWTKSYHFKLLYLNSMNRIMIIGCGGADESTKLTNCMTMQAGQQNSTADEPYVGRRVHDYSGGLANTIASSKVRAVQDEKNVFILKNNRELENFLGKLESPL